MNELRTVIITRSKGESSREWGTFGHLQIAGTGGAEFTCVTLERPWLDNHRDDPVTPENDSSCVPTGTYIIKPRLSPKHGRKLYELQDVPGRTNCQIHAANWAHELLGCIALGRTIDFIGGGKGITHSAVTLRAFMAAMRGAEEARLIIEEGA